MKKIALIFVLSLSLSTPAVLLIAGSVGPGTVRAASGEEVEAAVRHAEQELASAQQARDSF